MLLGGTELGRAGEAAMLLTSNDVGLRRPCSTALPYPGRASEARAPLAGVNPIPGILQRRASPAQQSR